LQAQTNSLGVGLGVGWVNVADSVQTNHVSFPLDMADGAVFFRLVHP
jgi:hypothetical protein